MSKTFTCEVVASNGSVRVYESTGYFGHDYAQEYKPETEEASAAAEVAYRYYWDECCGCDTPIKVLVDGEEFYVDVEIVTQFNVLRK